MKPELIIVGAGNIGTKIVNEIEMARGIKVVQAHSIPSGPEPIQITNPYKMLWNDYPFMTKPKKQNSNFTKPKKKRKK